MATPDSVSEEEESEVESRTPRPLAERFQTAIAMIKSLPKEGKKTHDYVLCACAYILCCAQVLLWLATPLNYV